MNPPNIQHYQGKRVPVTNNSSIIGWYGKCEKIMKSKYWMNGKENILLQSSGEDDRAD